MRADRATSARVVAIGRAGSQCPPEGGCVAAGASAGLPTGLDGGKAKASNRQGSPGALIVARLFPASRHGSSGSWSNGSTSRPMACKCGCGLRAANTGRGTPAEGSRMKSQAAGDNGASTARPHIRWHGNATAAVRRSSRPNGGDARAPAKPGPDGTLIRALARAHRWKRLLEEGQYWSAGEIEEAEGCHAQLRQPAAAAHPAGAGHLRRRSSRGRRRACSWRN